LEEKDMNSAWLYRKQGRSILWIAFMTAIAIHLGAVALAKNKLTTTTVEYFAAAADIEIVNPAAPESALEESVTPAPLEQTRADEDSFPEENLKPVPVRPHGKARSHSPVRGTTSSLRSIKAMMAYAPRPVYPYEARRRRLTGSGVALLTVDQISGDVIDVMMAQSCGNAILDNSTRDALRRWRFKPGSLTNVQVPITYTLMGVSY
jgi:TonB family protein